MVSRNRHGWIGVDIGTRSVKLAQLERCASGIRLCEAMVIPRASSGGGAVHESRPIGARTEICNALRLGKGFSGYKAACTLSMHWCQVNLLTVPVDSEAERRSIVASHLTNTRPDRSEPLAFDFWPAAVADNEPDEMEQDVIALSVAHQLATEAGRDLYDSGLSCQTLDGIPLALSRAVRMASAPHNQSTVAAIDWGFADATFCAINQSGPVFVRRLRNCGFGNVLRCIGQGIGASLDELEGIFTGGSLPRELVPAGEQLQQVLHEVASEPLSIVLDELVKTLEFLERQSSLVVPEQIWLFGAGALWNNAPAFLSSRIGLPVEKWCLEKAGISVAPNLAVRTEVLAPAIALSSLAWTGP